MAKAKLTPDDELISIPLHPKHWVVILGSLETTIAQATRKAKELRKQGVDHTTLPEALITALAAPPIVRGIIVKALTARGIMKREANEQLGIDKIMDQIRKYRGDL